MVPGLPCLCGHVTVAGACQRETHTPSLRGWGWGVKDGSRLPSPRLFSFSRQGLGHSMMLRTDSQGRNWGEKRKEANSITSRTSHMICRPQCKRKRWGPWFRECSEDQASISTLNPVWDQPSSSLQDHSIPTLLYVCSARGVGKQVACVCKLWSSVHWLKETSNKKLQKKANLFSPMYGLAKKLFWVFLLHLIESFKCKQVA